MAVRKSPTKGWFKRCVDRVFRDGGAYDPEAVCGALLKRKKAAGYVPAKRRRSSQSWSKPGRRQPLNYATKAQKREMVRDDRKQARTERAATRTKRRTKRASTKYRRR